MGALALLASVVFLGTTVLAGNGPPFPGEVRYVAVGSPASVQFPEQVLLILDCVPFAISTYGVEANLSSIQWFRIASIPPERVGAEAEITDNSTMNIFLAENKERLFIRELTIATGAQVGTEAAYRCKVCGNVPLQPQLCANATTVISAISPPVLECVNPPPPIDPYFFFIIIDVDIGCDLCIEPGQSVDILTIMCVPRTSRIPYDCIITTPNGTNVLDIVDPIGNEITVQRAGHTGQWVSMSPVSNPDVRPLGFDVLGTWTCQCNNSDGRSVASSKLGSCSVAPIIDAGAPSDSPLRIDRENFLGKIGSTLHIVEGQSATITCGITFGSGKPEGSVKYAWYYMGMQIMDGEKFMIMVADDKHSSTLTVNNFTRADNGQIRCVALNPAGQSQASSDVFVYSDVLIDKGNASVEIGPDEPLTGKVGDKFLVPIGKRACIKCDLEDAGGFPNDSSANPPLPGRMQWFKNGEPVDLRLFNSSHGNQLCVDMRSANDSGNYECRVTSRIVNGFGRDAFTFQMDSATSNVIVLLYPECTFRYCKRKRNALCTKIDADGDCSSKVTSCMAAYYSVNERAPPGKCSRRNRCAGLTGERLEKCLRKWSNCVKKAFKAQHGKTPANLRKKAFFKTLEYPCGG